MSARRSNRSATGPGAPALGDIDDLGYQTHRLSRLLRHRLEGELATLGLTGPQAAVLLLLAAAAEPRPPAALAERLGMDRPTLSGVIARLERDGWLLSQPNPDDGRSRLLRLSSQAEAALPTLRAASGRASARALRDLNHDDVRLLMILLRSVAQSLEAEEEEEVGQ